MEIIMSLSSKILSAEKATLARLNDEKAIEAAFSQAKNNYRSVITSQVQEILQQLAESYKGRGISLQEVRGHYVFVYNDDKGGKKNLATVYCSFSLDQDLRERKDITNISVMDSRYPEGNYGLTVEISHEDYSPMRGLNLLQDKTKSYLSRASAGLKAAEKEQIFSGIVEAITRAGVTLKPTNPALAAKV
jgi:hypothetical protein